MRQSVRSFQRLTGKAKPEMSACPTCGKQSTKSSAIAERRPRNSCFRAKSSKPSLREAGSPRFPPYPSRLPTRPRGRQPLHLEKSRQPKNPSFATAPRNQEVHCQGYLSKDEHPNPYWLIAQRLAALSTPFTLFKSALFAFSHLKSLRVFCGLRVSNSPVRPPIYPRRLLRHSFPRKFRRPHHPCFAQPLPPLFTPQN